MTVHLIKLCVGADSVSELASWQGERLKAMKKAGQKQELMHITRHRPKRAEEVLDGGSLYWVIKGRIAVRQKIMELRPVLCDGITHCAMVVDKELVTVRPHPRRPFQGWRYLNAAEAPPDMTRRSGEKEQPYEMERELMELGLL